MYSEYRQRSPARKDPFYGDRIPILPALRTRGGFCVPFLRAGDTRPNKQDPASEENVGEGLGPPKKIPHQCAHWVRDDKDMVRPVILNQRDAREACDATPRLSNATRGKRVTRLPACL